jgi:hypothetical protein
MRAFWSCIIINIIVVVVIIIIILLRRIWTTTTTARHVPAARKIALTDCNAAIESLCATAGAISPPPHFQNQNNFFSSKRSAPDAAEPLTQSGERVLECWHAAGGTKLHLWTSTAGRRAEARNHRRVVLLLLPFAGIPDTTCFHSAASTTARSKQRSWACAANSCKRATGLSPKQAAKWQFLAT